MAVDSILELALHVIRIDGGTQPRASLDWAYITDLAQAIQDGVSLPPVNVFYDGNEYWLADGFHRYHGNEQAGRKSIQADVRQGTRRDAILYSVGANAQHGLRRTNADKKRSVETLLNDPEWAGWSDREIARRTYTTHPFVAQLRTLTGNITSESERSYVTKHGTVATMNTSNIGRSSIPQDDITEAIPSSHLVEELKKPSFPSSWGLVDGKPFTASLPDGKLVQLSEEWKLPTEMRFSSSIEKAEPIVNNCGVTVGWIADSSGYRNVSSGIQATPIVSVQPEVRTGISSVEPPARVVEHIDISPVLEKSVLHEVEDVEVEDIDIPEVSQGEKSSRDLHVMRVMGSSDSPEWYTPQNIVQRVCNLMGTIDLDPCSNSRENPNVPAHTLYTREDDGLSQKWRGKTYLNPPYGTEISRWTNKLIDEHENGDVEEAVTLLPGRIDTNWFQPLYGYVMCNVRGRIQFENSPYHCPFPCVIVYLGKREDAFIDTFKEMGPIMRRIA